MSNTDLHSNASKELDVHTPAEPLEKEAHTPPEPFEKDVEVQAAKEYEAEGVAAGPVNPRAHISRWRWWLTLIGLYLGAPALRLVKRTCSRLF